VRAWSGGKGPRSEELDPSNAVHFGGSKISNVKSEKPHDTRRSSSVAFTGPTFAAGDVKSAKTELDCKKASGMWDATAKLCSEKKM